MWVSSNEAPSPSQDAARFHPTICRAGCLNLHAQQFSTVQIMYAEHGSQALLDALVAVHGLQGSLWKNPFLTELHMRKLDIMSMQRKTMATMCPAYYVLRNTLCRITFD